MDLIQICNDVQERCDRISTSLPDWPCHKDCDDCCRTLAAVPLVSEVEWRRIYQAIDSLPDGVRSAVHTRIAGSRTARRPVTCPLLDEDAHACLIYEARPLACRTYGFYAERDGVLGCWRIRARADTRPDIIWGNHESIVARVGPTMELWRWL